MTGGHQLNRLKILNFQDLQMRFDKKIKKPAYL